MRVDPGPEAGAGGQRGVRLRCWAIFDGYRGFAAAEPDHVGQIKARVHIKGNLNIGNLLVIFCGKQKVNNFI